MGASTTSIVTTPSPLATSRAVDTAADAVANQLKASSAVLHKISIDNTAGSQKVYVPFFNVLAASVTLGTTVPDGWVCCPAGVSLVFTFRNLTDSSGITLGTALTIACTTAPGGNVSPTVAPKVEVQYT